MIEKKSIRYRYDTSYVNLFIKRDRLLRLCSEFIVTFHRWAHKYIAETKIYRNFQMHFSSHGLIHTTIQVLHTMRLRFYNGNCVFSSFSFYENHLFFSLSGNTCTHTHTQHAQQHKSSMQFSLSHTAVFLLSVLCHSLVYGIICTTHTISTRSRWTWKF